MENMNLYNAVRTVPPEAQKTIGAGRLKGMTDINPMWRIQTLTEQFGPCGIGWKYTIREKKIESGPNGEMAAFVDIDLYYKSGDSWSEPIPGTGGASFVAQEKNGLHLSDECFKMALTDALSVACKAIGIGADVYWDAGRSKYSKAKENDSHPPSSPAPVCDRCGKPVLPTRKMAAKGQSANDLIAYTRKEFQMALCYSCMTKLDQERRNNEKSD